MKERTRFRRILVGIMTIIVAMHCGPLAAQDGGRVYSVLPVEDARAIVREVIDKTVNPQSLSERWSAPESGLYARGVKVDSDGYVVFAAASGRSTYIVKAEGGITPTFHTNGILATSIDLEIVAGSWSTTDEWIREASGGFVKRKRTQTTFLRKGVYEWLIAPSGLLLLALPPVQRTPTILEFEDAIGDFTAGRLYLADLNVVATDPGRFTVTVGGKTMVFR